MAIVLQPRYISAVQASKPQLNPLLKLVLDLGPLLLFFLANSRPALFLPLVSPILRGDSVLDEPAGIFVATAVFMVAVVVALAASYALTRRLPIMPLVTAIIVLVFGSLTLVLHDDTFGNPDLLNRYYLAWSIPLVAYLALVSFRPAAALALERRFRLRAPALSSA